MQHWDDTNVSLAFKDAQVIPPGGMMEKWNDGWKWLEIAFKKMAENGWDWLEWLEIAGMARNGLIWLEMAENGWKWLEMAENGWNGGKWLKSIEIAGNGLAWLE